MVADEAVQRVLAMRKVVVILSGILGIGSVIDTLGVSLQVLDVVDADDVE